MVRRALRRKTACSHPFTSVIVLMANTPTTTSISKRFVFCFVYGLILEVGFGKYQLGLLILCGWANASDAVEMMGVRNERSYLCSFARLCC